MNTPAFSETIPNELRELGYVPPIIKSYDNNGINVWLDNRIQFSRIPFWQFTMDGVQWMVLDERHGCSTP